MVMLRFGATLHGQMVGWVMQSKEVRKQGQMWGGVGFGFGHAVCGPSRL